MKLKRRETNKRHASTKRHNINKANWYSANKSANGVTRVCQWRVPISGAEHRYVGRAKRIWYLSPMRAAKVQASLRFRAVSPEPPLLAHTSSESRGTFRRKARSLAPLNGWACTVRICHDGMLEDTNSLDAAHVIIWVVLPSMADWQIGVCVTLFAYLVWARHYFQTLEWIQLKHGLVIDTGLNLFSVPSPPKPLDRRSTPLGMFIL